LKYAFLSGLAFLAFVPGASATPSDVNRVVAPGFAVAEVPPDSLTVEFQLEAAAGSFEQGAAKARAVAADLGSMTPPVDGIRFTVSHDLTFMQQKKWTSGTKQQHKFRLLAEHVPEGNAQKTMIAIVQSALKTNPDLTVVAFESRLSDARVKEVQAKLLKQAIADAHDFATIAATEANLSLRSVRSLSFGGPGSFSRPVELAESVMVGRIYGNASRSFSVQDELAATIRVSVAVSVEYDCESK
jgi:uncharacterized protein YggE